MTTQTGGQLVAPFPWFGGKSRAAAEIWRRFGDTPNYVEPFAGSLAVLLGRPTVKGRRTETVNDLDGFVANFWRAVADDPESVAAHADWPVNEADLHARHSWLVSQRVDVTDRLHGDPDWYDAKVAGWWVWGCCAWIGGTWCSGDGPWQVHDGRLIDTRASQQRSVDPGVRKQLPHLGDAGRGIAEWMIQLAARLRHVRVCCGDWTRVITDIVTTHHGVTGVLLDPPYGDDHDKVYATDSHTVAADVRQWCLANGHRADLRIALCGYSSPAPDPLIDAGWTIHRWSTKGGYGGGRGGQADANRRREAIWFSPACLSSDSLLDLIPTQTPHEGSEVA